MTLREELKKMDDRLGELLDYAQKSTDTVYSYSNITYYLKGAKDYIEDASQYIDTKEKQIRDELKRQKELKSISEPSSEDFGIKDSGSIDGVVE